MEIKPVNPKGNQPWIFIGRTDTVAEAEAPILWPDAKSGFIGKDPDAGEDWRQKEKGAEEDEMVRQHHWLIGYECEQTPGDSGGQRSLVCYSPQSCTLQVAKSQTRLSDWTATTRTTDLFLWLWCVFQNCGNDRVISVLYNDINSVLQHYKYIVLYEAELPGEGGNLKVRSPSHTVQTRPLNMTNGPLLSATDMWEKVSFLLASDFQLP